LHDILIDIKTYPITSAELFDRLKSTKRALHDAASLRGLFPITVRWSDDGAMLVIKPDPESIADACAELEADGALDIWPDAPGGWAVVFTVLTAESLGIELDGTGLRWRPIRSTQRATRIKKRRKVRGELEGGGLDINQIADPIPFDPIQAIEKGPRPGILLGERLIWNGPDQMHGGHYETMTRGYLVCPGCISSPITTNRTCLCCDDRFKPAGYHVPQPTPSPLISEMRLRGILESLI
jgi:hypothetical protein